MTLSISLLKHSWAIPLTLILLPLLLYANTLSHDFVWDDEILIVKNRYLIEEGNWKKFFTEDIFKGGDRRSNFWRPLQMLSYWLDQKIGGFRAFHFHLTNILLHGLTACLIYLYLFLLFRKKAIALLTSLLHVIHPIHTEAIAYISGRGDPLSLLFLLGSLCLYLHDTLSEKRKILSYTGALFCFVLSLMSKEMAVMLPLYLILTDMATWQNQKKKSWIHLFSRYLPFLLILFFYIKLRLTNLQFVDSSLLQDNPASLIPLHLRFVTFSRILMGFLIHPTLHHLDLGYIGLLFFPFHLHMERGMPYAQSLLEWPYLISLIGLILLVSATLLFLLNRRKLEFFALAFFLTALLPFSGIIPLNANMAEHWLYVPSIGFFLFLSNFFVLPTPNSKLLTFLIILYCLYLSTTTILENQKWKDHLTIWKQTAQFSDSSHIHGNLGVAYGREGNFSKAKEEFLKAVHIQFNYPEAHHNLGMLYWQEGKLEEAKQEFKWALQFNPEYESAKKNLQKVVSEIESKPHSQSSLNSIWLLPAFLMMTSSKIKFF